MKILASLVGDDWQQTADIAAPFGIHLSSTHGATASEPWFTAYFKSGRDNTVEGQRADVVLLETDIAGAHHSLILDLSKEEAQKLRKKCDLINDLRAQMDKATQLGDFATGEVKAYINEHT